MDTKIFLIGLFLIAAYPSASALTCYTCRSQKPNETCFEPIDKTEVPAYECGKDTTIPPETKALYEQSTYADNGLEYECVSYEYVERNSDKAIYERSCLLQSAEVDACNVLKLSLGIVSSNLTHCEVCDYDYCNGPNNSNILKATFNMSTIFLITFYYFLM